MCRLLRIPAQRAVARQAQLPVSAVGPLTFFFGVKPHMGRDRADQNLRFA
jgi:hypothetical protein